MSLYDKASIALIPSGTKASKLYSVLPANGNGDFTHTRGSTATRLNKDGLIESVATNVPRLDYPLIDGAVQDCPALLLEPSRTNRNQDTEAFNNWGNGGSLVTANQAISPDGSLTADELTKTSSFSAISRSNTMSTSGINVVYSIFVKKDTTDNITLRLAGSSNDVRRFFDLSSETSGASGGNQTGFVSEKIDEYPNGWYRVSIVCTTDSTTLTTNVYAGQAGNTTFDGEVYIWGSQLEEGDYITSYIPNSSGTTTRSADVCNGSGTSAEFKDSEGVLFTEVSALANSGGLREIAVSNGSNSQAVQIKYTSTNNRINGTIATTSGTIGMTFDVPSLLDYHKICLKYKASDFALWVDGFEVNTNTTVNDTPSGLNQLDFDRADGVNDFYGKTKQLMTFKTALTDNELETLTSYDSFDDMATGQLYTIE